MFKAPPRLESEARVGFDVFIKAISMIEENADLSRDSETFAFTHTGNQCQKEYE